MSGWLAMGGYAAFVWPAYGVSVAGLLAMAFLTLRGWWGARRALGEQARTRSGKAERIPA